MCVKHHTKGAIILLTAVKENTITQNLIIPRVVEILCVW
jgi:hypothetical protein